MIYYASLTRALMSLYYPIEAENEDIARRMIATSSLSKMWCSVYTEEQVDEFIKNYGGHKLTVRQLDYDYHRVFSDEVIACL